MGDNLCRAQKEGYLIVAGSLRAVEDSTLRLALPQSATTSRSNGHRRLASHQVRTSLAHHEYGDVAIKKRYNGSFHSIHPRKDYDVLQLLDMEHIGKAHTASRKSRSRSAHLHKQHLYYHENQRQPLLNHLWKGAKIACRGSRSADNPQRLPNSCNCR